MMNRLSKAGIEHTIKFKIKKEERKADKLEPLIGRYCDFLTRVKTKESSFCCFPGNSVFFGIIPVPPIV